MRAVEIPSATLICAIQSMSNINLIQEADALPSSWKSRIIGKAAGANVKVLRMDASSYPNEVHDFVEALLVLEGHMNLHIAGRTVCVQAGEFFMVPAGQPHAVAAGSQGTLVIIDQ
jgi:mannose-6-phosphate isomerase-like protein (cupin superfamily)